MATCFTCGSPVDSFSYSCPICNAMTALTDLRHDISRNSLSTTAMATVQMAAFNAMQKTVSKGLSEMAAAIQWGFTEVSWQVQQQTDVLKRIDETLLTPSETQANESRRMAEELVRRRVFDEAEEFFKKSLNLNRLDYRTYIGLANVLLRRGAYKEALGTLEKSLPHAPAEGQSPIANWRSYSLRLMGRIHSCLGDLRQAEASFYLAFQLSPRFAEVAYDLAVVRAQQGNGPGSMQALRTAIQLTPLYWYLPQRQRAFMPVEKELRQLLAEIRDGAKRAVRSTLDEVVGILNEIRPEIAELTSQCSGWKYSLVTLDAKAEVQGVADGFTRVSQRCEELERAVHVTDYMEILRATDAARDAKTQAMAVREQLRQAASAVREDLYSVNVGALCMSLIVAVVVAIMLIIIVFGH